MGRKGGEKIERRRRRRRRQLDRRHIVVLKVMVGFGTRLSATVAMRWTRDPYPVPYINEDTNLKKDITDSMKNITSMLKHTEAPAI